jgi:hypothetical protein
MAPKRPRCTAMGISRAHLRCCGTVFVRSFVWVAELLKEGHRFGEARIFFSLSCCFLAVRMTALAYSRLHGAVKWVAVALVYAVMISGVIYLLGIVDGAQREHESDQNERNNDKVKLAMAEHPKTEAPERLDSPPPSQLLVTGYKILPIAAGRHPTIEVDVKNTSAITLRDEAVSSISVRPCTDDANERDRLGEAAFKEAKNFAKKHRTPVIMQVPPYAQMHIEVEATSATDAQIKNLLQTPATACVYFAGFFDYPFNGYRYETPFCAFTDKWDDLPNCTNHNDPKVIGKIPSSRVEIKPDVTLRIVRTKTPSVVVVPADATPQNINVTPLLFDLDGADQEHSLNIRPLTFDWIRLDQRGAPMELVNASDNVKAGHRVFGFISVTCPKCAHVRSYWIYFVYGSGGWYAELPDYKSPDPAKISEALPGLRAKGEAAMTNVPPTRRPITEN